LSDKGKLSNKRADILVDTLQHTNQFLQILVGLGESLLTALERSSTPAASSQATAPRSAARSVHSENSTDAGVIDLSAEEIISFAEASALIATRPSVSTISRWCSTGCHGIHLESTYIGARRKTTKQAIERFLTACRERGWAGMHDNSAYVLERAMARREASDERVYEDGPPNRDLLGQRPEQQRLPTHRAELGKKSSRASTPTALSNKAANK
jgi:hypothetical protein